MDILIDESNEGKTIRSLLRGDMGYSSAMLKKLKFSEGGILVNGEFRTVRYELKFGDVLSLAIEDTEEDVSPYIIPVELPIGICYSDSFLTVVNKPSDMPAHPSCGHREDTVANALAFLHKPEPYVFRPVNRLDRDTSGAMLVANSRFAAYTLYKSMVGGEIKKKYIAILDGTLNNKEGYLESYMRRCDDSIVKREICRENDGGKLARTYYRVLFEKNGYTVVEASPETGRTHQLRLHFASQNAPITGDSMYGSESEYIPRQALHAYSLSFPHPKTKEVLTVFADIPDDMKELSEKLFGDLDIQKELLCYKN